MAVGVVEHAAHAGGEAARASTVARRRPRAAHALCTPRQALRALRVRVRAPRGLRTPYYLWQGGFPHTIPVYVLPASKIECSKQSIRVYKHIFHEETAGLILLKFYTKTSSKLV